MRLITNVSILKKIIRKEGANLQKQGHEPKLNNVFAAKIKKVKTYQKYQTIV